MQRFTKSLYKVEGGLNWSHKTFCPLFDLRVMILTSTSFNSFRTSRDEIRGAMYFPRFAQYITIEYKARDTFWRMINHFSSFTILIKQINTGAYTVIKLMISWKFILFNFFVIIFIITKRICLHDVFKPALLTFWTIYGNMGGTLNLLAFQHPIAHQGDTCNNK